MTDEYITIYFALKDDMQRDCFYCTHTYDSNKKYDLLFGIQRKFLGKSKSITQHHLSL